MQLALILNRTRNENTTHCLKKMSTRQSENASTYLSKRKPPKGLYKSILPAVKLTEHIMHIDNFTNCFLFDIVLDIVSTMIFKNNTFRLQNNVILLIKNEILWKHSYFWSNYFPVRKHYSLIRVLTIAIVQYQIESSL